MGWEPMDDRTYNHQRKLEMAQAYFRRVRVRRFISILSPATIVLTLVLAGSLLTNRSNSGSNVTIIDASWARGYGSLKELAISPYTTVVVKGVVIGAESYVETLREPTLGPGLVFTDYVLEVQLVLKGSLKVSDTITIHQTGGTVGGYTMVVWDDPPLRVGDVLILFLHECEPGKYFIEGGPQGRFTIRDGSVYSLGEMHAPADDGTGSFRTYGQSESQFIGSIESALMPG
jgi:hypothetical protein